jgi:IS1 family transposase
LSWDVVKERSPENMQACLDQGPSAKQYYSDMFHYYSLLDYRPGQHRSLNNKSQTYSVEAVNANMRHYLRRLARRSRCFSRSYKALRNTLSIFVYCHNQRQCAKIKFPDRNFGLSDFAATCF